jgi:ABC-type glycerol-3-phosphate transport system permease component
VTDNAPTTEGRAVTPRRPTAPLRALRRLPLYAVLILVGAAMLVPFLWMITTSLKPSGATFSYPPQLIPTSANFANYRELFTFAPFGRYFLNSAVVTGATVVGQVAFCATAAYGFARLRFAGVKAIFVLFLATMMIPFQVTMIPLFLIVFKLHWVNTYQGLIAPGVSSAFGIFLLRQAFLSIPRDYQDAARIDGASEWTVFFRIFLPLVKPALATVSVFAFMGTWNDLLWPLLISRDQDMRTVELGLAYFNVTSSAYQQPNWPLMMAASVVSLLPVMGVYLFAQRYFVAGISLTGVKG